MKCIGRRICRFAFSVSEVSCWRYRLSLEWLINPLNAELNPICHLLALLGGATIVGVSRLRVNSVLPPLYFWVAKSHGGTNPVHQVVRRTKFGTVSRNTYGSSVWNLLHVTSLVPRFMSWFLDL